MPKYKVTPIINSYCHRIVYFVLPTDYDYKNKSLEQLYADSLVAEFNKKDAAREAIRLNLKDNKLNLKDNKLNVII